MGNPEHSIANQGNSGRRQNPEEAPRRVHVMRLCPYLVMAAVRRGIPTCRVAKLSRIIYRRTTPPVVLHCLYVGLRVVWRSQLIMIRNGKIIILFDTHYHDTVSYKSNRNKKTMAITLE